MAKPRREDHPGGRSREALELRREAATQRLIAEEYRQAGTDMGSVAFHVQEANRLKEQATDLLQITGELTIGTGGEVVTGKYALDTLARNPDAVNVAASANRYDLIEQAGVSELALDAAGSIKEPNSLEKMLAHQMAVCHDQALTLIVQANAENDTVERARLLNCAARMMKCYQDGLLTLNRVRTGGTQRVIVQHVQVNDGGQAVVAGEVGGGKNGGG